MPHIIPWKPMFDPFEGLDAIIGRPSMTFETPVDVYVTDNDVVVETPMPGMDPENLELTVADGVLTVQGSMERKTEVDEKDYYRKEVRSGTLFRRIPLPAPVKDDAAEALLENGMLRVTIPKLSESTSKPVKIEVKKKS